MSGQVSLHGLQSVELQLERVGRSCLAADAVQINGKVYEVQAFGLNKNGQREKLECRKDVIAQRGFEFAHPIVCRASRIFNAMSNLREEHKKMKRLGRTSGGFERKRQEASVICAQLKVKLLTPEIKRATILLPCIDSGMVGHTAAVSVTTGKHVFTDREVMITEDLRRAIESALRPS
jgi:hypothetical protein